MDRLAIVRRDAAEYGFGDAMVRVRLLVWGMTTADQERAIHHAGHGHSRNAWRFVQTERLIGAVCPIDVRDPDPKALAAEQGYGWAYVVYRAEVAR